MLLFMVITSVKAQLAEVAQPDSFQLDSIIQLIDEPKEPRFINIVDKEEIKIYLYHPDRIDMQKPHTKDEYYFVATGSGKYFYDGRTIDFKQGDLLFAEAGKDHKFVDFTSDLFVWVIFY
ncbi:cupin domain-containing protein [Flagellimonas sp. S3867]|uniref:cupin domain-containing protein n=1 Tax=Flagellimonas sp. S3867 TaxID=2768063 RepID=UPI00168477D7|nr:cupin domain-containing protein [Flagellimonas sp. S3867]